MNKKELKFYEELTETELVGSTVNVMSINEERVDNIIKLMKADTSYDYGFKLIINLKGIVFDDIYDYSVVYKSFILRTVEGKHGEELICEDESVKADLMDCSKFIVVPTTKTIFAWEE